MMRVLIITLPFIVLSMGCSGGEPHETTNPTKRSDHTQVDSVQVPKSTTVKLQSKPSSDSDAESIPEMRFEREVTYGTTDDVVVGEIATFVVDDQDRVFIADEGQTVIHIFNPDASYLTSLGRKGKGPGEFTAIYQVSTFMTLHSNQLYVSDFAEGNVSFPHRVNVFSMEDLSFSHTINLIPENKDKYEEMEGFYPKRAYPLTDGRFLIAYHRSAHEYRDTESFIYYVIQDSTGKIVSDPILKQKDLMYLTYRYPSGITHMHSFPFFGKSLLAISDDERLYAAWSQEFTIDVYDTNGELLRTIRKPFNNRALDVDKVVDRYEKIDYMAQLDRYEGDNVALKMIRNANNLPETWPALQIMFFDNENRLWISTIVDNNEVYEWWILKTSGKVIGKFKWPRDKSIEVVQNGYMYIRETEEETGLQSIVRYSVNMNGGSD